MAYEDQTAGELFRDRSVLFILAVLSVIAAFAWNDFMRLALREQNKDSDLLRRHLIYAIIATGILILTIALFAWLFKTIPGL